MVSRRFHSDLTGPGQIWDHMNHIAHRIDGGIQFSISYDGNVDARTGEVTALYLLEGACGRGVAVDRSLEAEPVRVSCRSGYLWGLR